MSGIRHLAMVLLLVFHVGCSEPRVAPSEPGDPKAVEVLEAHWAALSRGDWQSAHAWLRPELKAMFPLKKFTDFHAKRRKSGGIPRAIQLVGSESSGEDVIVSFDALYATEGGGEPVPVPPRRRVRLRKSGNTWCLMTHDLFAVGP